jgi:hypothetical protein
MRGFLHRIRLIALAGVLAAGLGMGVTAATAAPVLAANSPCFDLTRAHPTPLHFKPQPPAVLGVTVSFCSMVGADATSNASTSTNRITAASRGSSGRANASGVLFDPICNAFFIGNPPNLVLVHGKLTVSGSSEYPGCEGSATNKALTTRQGKVCLQVYEGTTRRGTWRNVRCSTRTFPTRAFGTYTLTAGRVCPAHRHLHQYRMWQWLYIQRGVLSNKASGAGLRRSIKC